MKCKYCESEMTRDDTYYTCVSCESYYHIDDETWYAHCSGCCCDIYENIYKQDNEMYCESCIKDRNDIRESKTIYYYSDDDPSSGDEDLDEMIRRNFDDVEIIEQ